MRRPTGSGQSEIERPIPDGAYLWERLMRSGGLQLDRYDKTVEDEVRSRLSVPKRASLVGFLRQRRVSTRDLLVPLLVVLRPWSRMMVELLTLFEQIGARRGSGNLQMKFDFGDDAAELDFDLRHFREIVEHWARVVRPVAVRRWTISDLWNLEEPLRVPHERQRRPSTGPVARWIERYDQGIFIPDLPCPKSGDERFDEEMRKAWDVWVALLSHACRTWPPTDELPGVVSESSEEEIDQEFNMDGGASRFLNGKMDRWARLFAEEAYLVADDLSKLQGGDLHSRAEQVTQQLASVMEAVPSTVRDIETVEREIEELLSLPIWKRRHDLYSVWVLARIVEALGGVTALSFHHEGDVFVIRFSGTHIATLDSVRPRLHLWAELRSPLKHPRGKGRVAGIQPDYRLLVEPLSELTSAVVGVECKQYMRASGSRFSTTLEDYARGMPTARILLVNYGKGGASSLKDIKKDLAVRCAVIDQFRPFSSDSLGTLTREIRECISTRVVPVTLPQGSGSAPDTVIPAIQKVMLTWKDHPEDLDLYLSVPTDNELEVISYKHSGSMEGTPFAALDQDMRSGRGPESITIGKVREGAYRCAVHNFSGESPLANSGAMVEVQLQSGIIRVECPSGGCGRWWHVFDWAFPDGALRVVNEIGDSFPR